MGEIRTWTDKDEYIAVLRKEIQVLKTEINSMKEDLSDIKNMLLSLMDKGK